MAPTLCDTQSLKPTHGQEGCHAWTERDSTLGAMCVVYTSAIVPSVDKDHVGKK